VFLRCLGNPLRSLPRSVFSLYSSERQAAQIDLCDVLFRHPTGGEIAYSHASAVGCSAGPEIRLGEHKFPAFSIVSEEALGRRARQNPAGCNFASGIPGPWLDPSATIVINR